MTMIVFIVGLALGGTAGFFIAALCAAVSLNNRRFRKVKCGKCGNEFVIDLEGDYGDK